jgi:hypothetical protein
MHTIDLHFHEQFLSISYIYPAEEKTRSQEPDTQRANRQSEINNEAREEGQDESPAQADQSEEKGVKTEQHTET